MTAKHAAEARLLEIATRKARYQRWLAKHGDRLAAHHPDVAAEARSVVEARFMAEHPHTLTDADLRACRMRVATRLRIKRYGACTDDEETGRQLRECVAALDAQGRRDAA